MKYLLSVFICLFLTVPASATQLVFEFVNPAFNANSQSGDYLLDTAHGKRRGSRSGTNSNTPTYNISISDGAIVLQNGTGNSSTITIQSGNDNNSTSTINN